MIFWRVLVQKNLNVDERNTDKMWTLQALVFLRFTFFPHVLV